MSVATHPGIASIAETLRRGLAQAQTGRGSHGANYDGATLARVINEVIVAIDDAGTKPTGSDNSKYHAWKQSIEKALTLFGASNTTAHNGDLQALLRYLDLLGSQSSSMAVSSKTFRQWLAAVKAGAVVCEKFQSKGDASTLHDDISKFITERIDKCGGG